MGSSEPCPALKSLSNKIGGMFCRGYSPRKKTMRVGSQELERKIIEVRRYIWIQQFLINRKHNPKVFSTHGGIEGDQRCIEQYDEDSNETIDCEKLRKCLEELQIHLTEQEVDDLFESCYMDGRARIQFINEFVVLMGLIYLLVDHSSLLKLRQRMCLPQVEATFNSIITAFLFLDKNDDGKLSKTWEKALNEASPWEKSPKHITRTWFTVALCVLTSEST